MARYNLSDRQHNTCHIWYK